MSSSLNDHLLKNTSLAAILVISGVVVKNSFEQMQKPNDPVGKPLGMALFAMGWLYTAYILSLERDNKALFIVASLGIFASVMGMKDMMSKGKAIPMLLPAIFALSWIAIGYGVGQHLSGSMKYLGLVASALVIVGMLGVLPGQRKACIVDGPGMPMFVIAWGIIVYLNSSR